MIVRHGIFILLTLLIARPALAHNPFGVEAILGYLLLSPFVMLATIVISIVVLKRTSNIPLSIMDILVISGLMILASLFVMIPAFFVLALASQALYLNTSLFFLYFLLHFVAALIVPVAFYYVRKYKERKTIESNTA